MKLIWDKARQTLVCVWPLNLGLGGVRLSQVFALLERDPSLLDAHKVAREAFGQDPSDGSDFMPHASLLYGDLPMSTREAIRLEAGVGLVDPGITLEFESIEVWCTKGVVAEWKPVATLPIG